MKSKGKKLVFTTLVGGIMVFMLGCTNSTNNTENQSMEESKPQIQEESKEMTSEEMTTEEKTDTMETNTDQMWGSIPYTSEVGDMLLDGMTNDYFITYYPETLESVYPNPDDLTESVGYTAEYYFVVSFTEEGYKMNRGNSLFVFKSEEDAVAVEEYWMSQNMSNIEIKRDGKLLMQYNHDETLGEYSMDEYDKKDSYMENYPVVAGEHEAMSDNQILYMSMPLTAK